MRWGANTHQKKKIFFKLLKLKKKYKNPNKQTKPAELKELYFYFEM